MATLNLQPDGTAGVDNVINSTLPTTNFGTSTAMAITWASGTTLIRRGLIRFDLSAIPAGSAISAAALTFNHADPTGDATGKALELHRITQPAWTELGSTWNTYDGTNNWASAGGDFVALAGATEAAPAAGGGAGTVEYDVKTLAQDALDERSGLLDLLIRLDNESGSDYSCVLRSSDYTTALERPLLAITYNAPPVITVTGPADESVHTYGDTITFAASADDSDDGALDPTDISVTSDLDGAMGNLDAQGELDVSTLSVGTHTITFAVLDSEALEGTEEITVHVVEAGRTTRRRFRRALGRRAR